MTAMTTLPFRPDGWTVEDLELLPDDPPFRYELVDGTLLVSPPPPNAHNLFANELSHLLHGALTPDWLVLAPGAVEFDVRNWRSPDLFVVRREALRRKWAQPGEALLALEVMSPSSVSTDRVTKPAQYATAGIPHFWRFEPPEQVLWTYRLDGDVYRVTGRFDDEVVVDEPVALRFRLADLLP
jgi:Uma2 family endonuclease